MKAYTKDDCLRILKEKRPDVEMLGEYKGWRIHTKFKCKDCGYEWNGTPSDVARAKMCQKCVGKVASRNFLTSYKDIEKKLKDKIEDIVICDPSEYGGVDVKMHFEFTKCGHSRYTTPWRILIGTGRCPTCAQTKMSGHNKKTQEQFEKEIYSKMKEVLITGEYKDIDTPVDCKCLRCGNNYKMHPYWSLPSVNSTSNHCPFCSADVSYPNKFSRAFLKQLPIESFDTEWSPDWAGLYKYDNHFMFNNTEYAIEMDGDYHDYDDNYLRDIEKTRLAKENNVVLIRIDSRQSKPSFIIDNIKSSLLNQLFDLETIDWGRCDDFASSSMITICSDLYKKGLTPEDISKEIHISKGNVRNYLHRAKLYGMCPEYPNQSINIFITQNLGKKVNVYDTNNQILKTYDSKSKCVREFERDFSKHINGNTLSNRLNKDVGKPYKGYIFKYA